MRQFRPIIPYVEHFTEWTHFLGGTWPSRSKNTRKRYDFFEGLELRTGFLGIWIGEEKSARLITHSDRSFMSSAPLGTPDRNN